MLQRVQTVYMGIAMLVSAFLPFVFKLWKVGNVDFYFMSNIVYAALFGLSATLSLLSIMTYKNRKQQFVLNRLNMILNLILLGLLIYRSLSLPGEAPAVSEKGIGMFLPAIAIVFLVLANKAIKRDEDLVKSVDRLR
jgi:hypothetical protein